MIKERDKTNMGKETTKTESSIKNQTSPLYKILLLNDNVTPLDFVIELLIVVFHKSREEAVKIAFDVHQDGKGVCGLYSLEIAETKAVELMECARQSRHPLECRIEKA